MSDHRTPLGGASRDGRVRVEEMPRRGMITLRGDLSDATFAGTVTALSGTGMPGQRKVELADGGLLAWMSPDELLLVMPPEDVAGALDRIASDLSGQHHLAAEVTDARAVLRLSGEDAAVRETLGKLMPVDFAPGAFGPGDIRRTRLAQVPAAVWCVAPGDFGVICFRSVAEYVYAALTNAAAEGGAVGHY
ncbi:hypothetical protein ATO6_12935 [Oceanicola sp. 22II-s10i]|uniref:sarcosine oxidase subunit gamma n=1 Tax=Oceanicola sp. 22II-s10i TaxID=1317116 RepID=UPI000B525B94|nr:sarcosine oxidase subunit gamma family protein [Oceanicola sp. 22II-s10i]OWU84569.1 hypothetical protein ATO6_12935 [Oceanicola sp. 22II-s10i]